MPIMRLKKGSKVEVFCQNEKPAGSWRYAEIICGNGHNYTVKFNVGQFNESIEEKVSRKSIRPSPPPMVLSEDWRPGDVVEVLHNFSWKMATVSKALVGDQFLVRLSDAFNEFEVCKFQIRLRQTWLDDKWVVIGKSSLNYDHRESKPSLPMKHNPISWSQVNGADSEIKLQGKNDRVGGKNNFQSSHNISPRALKREATYCSQAEACRQKSRVIERDGKYHPEIVENLTVKVVTNAIGGEMIVDKTKNRKRSLSSMDEEIINGKGAVGRPTLTNLEPNHNTSSASSSSVGSNDPVNWPGLFVHQGEDAEDRSSDAESVCWSFEEERKSSPSKEQLASEIHRLELHAYRCTMEALHASGPLSWEKETLMANLRISLNISNDEHLMELRYLISNSSNSHFH